MKCPMCGKPLMKDVQHTFCPYCGYLDDGEIIQKYKGNKASDLEIYLGNDYDKIVRNNTFFPSLVLGPLYFCFRGFLLLGLIFQALEIGFWILLSRLGKFGMTANLLLLVAVCISRTFCLIFNNSICIFLYRRQIKKIKKKYPTHYLDKLRAFHSHTVSYVGVFLILFLFLFIVFFYIFISI